MDTKDVVDLIRYDVPPDQVFLDGIDLRNYEITYRRVQGETLEEIGEDFGLTREAIRLIVQKTYGPEIKNVIKAKRAARVEIVAAALEEIKHFILSHKGIRASELFVNFPTLNPEQVREIGSEILKFVNFERESKTYSTVWSDELILEAIREAGTYFFPLGRNDYESLIQSGEVDGPSGALVMLRFGTWAQACAKAGVESHRTNINYTKKWSELEQTDFVVQFLESNLPGSSMANYEEWKEKANPHAPSSQLLRNTFGGWLEVIATALQELRSKWESKNIPIIKENI